jgi:predicted extracellular nuclease
MSASNRLNTRMSRMVMAAVLVLSMLAALLPAAVVFSSTSGVVISEFQFRGPTGGNDEFVELLNTSSTSVDISGWALQGCAGASGAASNRVSVPGGTVLEPNDHYLFTNSNGYSGTVTGDATYATGFSDDGGARIVNGGTVIDGVGSASGAVDACREGVGLSLPTSNGDNAFERGGDGTIDTDDNVADFSGPQVGDPQNLSGDGGGGGETVTKIHDIQVPGGSSPMANQVVTIEGIVTGWDDEIGANFNSTFPEDAGIFVQEEAADWDADPNTSEAIFVGFVRERENYPLGSVVRLNGQVKEKFGLTMIAETINQEPVIVGTAPMPEPIVIDPFLAASQEPVSRPYYESLESMRVVLTVGTANSGGTNKFGELFLTPGTVQDRVFRDEAQPDLLATDADAGAGDPDNPYKDPDGSTTIVNADLFDQVQNVIGPLAFSFSHYKIMVQAVALPTVIDGPTPFPYDGLPVAGANEVRIAAFNVENYFPEGVELDLSLVTAEEEAEKRARLAAAIDTLLDQPDVIAVQEVYDLPLLQELADALGGYTAYLEEGNDSRSIDVGFLIKDTVTASNLRQLGKTATNPTSATCSDVDGGLFDRPPLFIDITTANGTTFTVVSNHFSSKSAPDECRAAQAAFVRDRVAEIEAAGGQVIVTGDLNAFEDESALTTLEDGTTTLDNLWDTAPDGERYSFQFDGRLQTLDHMLITAGLQPLVGGFQYAHFDNDYYERDAPDGHHVSDHDPPVLTLLDAPDEPEPDWDYTVANGIASFTIDIDGQQLGLSIDGVALGVASDPGMHVAPGVVHGTVVIGDYAVRYTVPRNGRGVATIRVENLVTGEQFVIKARATTD